MDAVVNFYKPPGMTSAQAVAFLKARTGMKAGHAGTLDPEAAGVLPILLGRATRLSDYLPDDKTYLAEVAFGAATDTQDAQGRITESGGAVPDAGTLAVILPRFTGDIAQIPPQFSALKVGGEAAYKLARGGKAVPLNARPVRIDGITLLRPMDANGFLLRVKCGKGTYIRALCHDIGQLLSCPAHMRFLLREESAGLRLEDSATPHDVAKWAEEGGFSSRPPWLVPMDQAVSHLPALAAPAHLSKPALNGARLALSEIPGGEALSDGSIARLFLNDGLLGVYHREGGALVCAVMLGA